MRAVILVLMFCSTAQASPHLGFSVVEKDGSVFVDVVYEGTPAATNNIQSGEELVALSARKVETSGDISKALKGKLPGQKVSVRLRSDDSARTISLVLTSDDQVAKQERAIASKRSSEKRREEMRAEFDRLKAPNNPIKNQQIPKESPLSTEDVLARIERKKKEKANAMKGLTIEFPYTVVWVPRQATAIEYGICKVLFDGEEPTNGFFKVDDDTHEIVMKSDNPEVMLPEKDPKHISGPYYFIFTKPGTATLTISVGQYCATTKFEVRQSAVAVGDPTETVIRELGLPSLKNKVFVKWPNTETHDCFIYQPKASDPFIGEHWWFEKYRDLILSVEDGKVVKFGTNRKRTDNQVLIRIPEPNAN